MAHRQFTDARGVVWDVYDVVSLPGFGRPGEPQLAPHSEVFRAARSWLVFESPTRSAVASSQRTGSAHRPRAAAPARRSDAREQTLTLTGAARRLCRAGPSWLALR